jgi:hypothetical protein
LSDLKIPTNALPPPAAFQELDAAKKEIRMPRGVASVEIVLEIARKKKRRRLLELSDRHGLRETVAPIPWLSTNREHMYIRD